MGKKAKKAQAERLFENAPSPAETGPVECLGMTFANDEARRAHFTELLRQKLRDPEFRKIEGFPIGEDEDIINLSDPPYYTACPNPWLSDFIRANQPAEALDDTAKEPFASDISEGKGHPLYNAHSYHTKVPHRAAMKYILHYTQPGDIILDGFCGTGMAGLAAQLCGDRSEVAAIGYSLDEDGIIRGEGGAAFAKLGVRRSILADLSPIATYIAYNYNTPTDVAQLVEEAEKICDDVETECGWMYYTIHSDGSRGHINCTVWSDVFECATCGSDVVYWDVAVDMRTADVLDEFPCPQCHALLSKRKAGKVMTTCFDTLLSRTVTTTKQVPVLISYTCNGKRYTKRPETSDLELIQRIQQSNIPYNVPSSRMMHSSDDTERWGDRWRAGSACFTHVHHLFTKRNLWVLGAFEHRIGRSRARFLLSGIINRSTQMNRIHLRNFVFGGGGWNAGYMKGAIYTPSLPIETSIFEQWKDRLVSVKAAFARLPVNNSNIIISTQSTTGLSIPDNSVDYVFVDPPFGANLNYSELNFLWESWLGVWTNNELEAVQSDFQKKGLTEYRLLMLSCFRNLYRVLKPGRWMTVEFSNTSAAVWNSIQVALSEAGFVVSNVSALDKKQGTFNAIRNSTSVKQDLVISAYKPTAQLNGDSMDFSDSEILIWSFVTSHLSYLPVAASSGKNVRVSPERDPRILFDQVVSFFVTHGQVIPISSHEFQLGLASRFVERDGMYFLPEQATAYDQMRLNAEGVQQQSLFVSDERSAITWIRRELSQQPMKYQDLSPRFMKEAQRVWDRHEQPVELRAILEQCFVVDEQGTWRVPDPKKESDLEQLRHRALLKEFQQYLDTKGRLKVLRTEALRAGFKECWQKKDYATIVTMAKRVPDAVIQEDPALLMYFDNASLMLGE